MADDPPEPPIRRKRTRGAPPAAKVKTEPAPQVAGGRLRRHAQADETPDDVEYKVPPKPAKKPSTKKPAAKKPSAAKTKKEEPTTYASSSDESSDSDDSLKPIQVTKDGPLPQPPDTLEAEIARSRADPLFAKDPAKDSDELLVIQFPTSLPASLPRRPSKRPRSDSNVSDRDEDAFDEVQRLKPGKIGTLQLLQSGDVRLKMGGETFDVDRGLLQTQAQQICSVDSSEGQLCVIGDVATKLVCTTHVPEEDWMANLRELIPRLQREQAEKEAARMRDD